MAYQASLANEATKKGLTVTAAAQDEDISELAREAAFEANDPHKWWSEWISQKFGRQPVDSQHAT